MREIHDLLNTLGEEQNVTAQKTALNDEALSLLELPRLSFLRVIITMRGTTRVMVDDMKISFLSYFLCFG